MVIIPTFNECDNLEPLVQQILALEENLGVIIVDDNSPDGTGELADKLARRYEEVQVIHRPGKLGLGTAYIAGFKLALATGAERVMTMDADFSHHPRYIPQLIAMAEVCHLTIGSRYVNGGGVRNWGWQRRFLSRTANLVVRLTLGLHAHDCTAGFRCYRREVLEGIDLDSIFSDGYSFLVEMLFCCQQLGNSVGEVPIIFENRRHGSSKISRAEIFKAWYTVLRLGWGRLCRKGGNWHCQKRRGEPGRLRGYEGLEEGTLRR
jgi:dolichol-phosphate mannosyltransferase